MNYDSAADPPMRRLLPALLLLGAAALALIPPPIVASEAPQRMEAPEDAGHGPDTVFLEELTWTEVAARIRDGFHSVIVPTGGTEQNGPHMVLGKHNYIIRHASERIARSLGNTLVAPVVDYVPEGATSPPSGHMRFAGTITLPEELFVGLLENAVRSLAAHGFENVILIGDSGGNQRGMEQVADRLNREWSSGSPRVLYVAEYYRANGFREWLLEQGETEETVGRHAGISDTSQLLYVAPEHIRSDRRAPGGGFENSGVSGDPTRASRAYGERGVALKVETTVNRVRELLAGRP